jgi:hypothetical protein
LSLRVNRSVLGSMVKNAPIVAFLSLILPVPTHANPSPHDADFAFPAASDILRGHKLTDEPKEERCEDLSPHYWR